MSRRNKLYPNLDECPNEGTKRLCEKGDTLDNSKVDKTIDVKNETYGGDCGPSKESKTNVGVLNFPRLFVSVLLICVGVILYKYIFGHIINNHRSEDYNEIFYELKRSAQIRSELSWKIINDTLRNHFTGGSASVKPSVINLVGTSDGVGRMVDMISTVLTRIGVSAQCAVFPGIDSSRETLDDKKLFIDGFIRDARHNHIKCAFFPNINTIPSSLGPYLHGLTDEISALFKDQLFLFSVDVALMKGPSEETVEEELIEVLRGAWMQGIGEERFDALMSRVAINVVLVT